RRSSARRCGVTMSSHTRPTMTIGSWKPSPNANAMSTAKEKYSRAVITRGQCIRLETHEPPDGEGQDQAPCQDHARCEQHERSADDPADGLPLLPRHRGTHEPPCLVQHDRQRGDDAEGDRCVHGDVEWVRRMREGELVARQIRLDRTLEHAN